MRLFIAEKPSLAREIAKGLGKTIKKNGYIEIEGTEDFVTWAYGHILQQQSPEMYDARYKKWDLNLLPIIPEKWALYVKSDAKEQFDIIKGLIQKADIIVNAGDPDREGQLLIDEILEYVRNKKTVKRILLNALDEKSVRAALGDLRDNSDFAGLKNSALARSRADWLIGMNLTRAFTVRAQQAGYSGVWRIGRVKTPTMALVVRREREIRDFRPKKHYKLEAVFRCENENGVIPAVWQPGEEVKGLDREGRVLQRADAENVLKKIRAAADISIADCAVTHHTENQRLPYSLSALQIEAGRKFGYAPKAVLDAAQRLYEAKYTTYPRSDCDYLPTNQLSDAERILRNLTQIPEWEAMVKRADVGIQSKAWNDGKISAHHAIIPTTLPCNLEKLDELDKNIYLLIARAYLAQFYPVHSYDKTKLTIHADSCVFSAGGKVITEEGWKAIYRGEEKEKGQENEAVLPAVQKGDGLRFVDGQVKELTTKPPKRFTEATLLEAMKNVHKYLRNPDYKDALKTVSGIGTEATRAGIIDELIKGGFLKPEKKMIVPTETAEKLFDVLTDGLTYPDMTALWEDKLSQIATQDFSYESFHSASIEMVRALLKEAMTAEIAPSKDQPTCPNCNKGLVNIKGKAGAFWKCASCAATFEDAKGKPLIFSCPKCQKGFLRRRQNQAKKNYFWGCSNYPECKATFMDENAKPKF